MKKNQRLTLWLESWRLDSETDLPPELCAFVALFNEGSYYEAHDVLEHLWLRCTDERRSFLQALIQLAGAFVHFQKHRLHPAHPTHGRRLSPGARLLELATRRMAPYGSRYLNLDVSCLIESCTRWKQLAHDAVNPLEYAPAPRLAGSDVAFPSEPATMRAPRIQFGRDANPQDLPDSAL
jgi:predicted metal-dependent hydrolase